MANRTQDRLKAQVALEAQIEKFNPDPRECVELIHALQACLRFQYEDGSADAQDALGAACQALEELDDTPLPGVEYRDVIPNLPKPERL